jgi:hypothetical protein
MTTAEKMQYFRENADARKAKAIGDNSMYGENIPQAQESLKMDYHGAKTAADSNAVRHAYDVNNPGSFPGTAKPGVTENTFYKKAAAALKNDPNAALKEKAYQDYLDAKDSSMNRKKSKQDAP